MQAQMFLTIGFTNWNMIEKYFRMHGFSSVLAKHDLLSLFFRVRVETPFLPKSQLIYFL